MYLYIEIAKKTDQDTTGRQKTDVDGVVFFPMGMIWCNLRNNDRFAQWFPAVLYCFIGFSTPASDIETANWEFKILRQVFLPVSSQETSLSLSNSYWTWPLKSCFFPWIAWWCSMAYQRAYSMYIFVSLFFLPSTWDQDPKCHVVRGCGTRNPHQLVIQSMAQDQAIYIDASSKVSHCGYVHMYMYIYICIFIHIYR